MHGHAHREAQSGDFRIETHDRLHPVTGYREYVPNFTVLLKGIYPEFQVIRGFSQKIPAGLLSYDQIHS